MKALTLDQIIATYRTPISVIAEEPAADTAHELIRQINEVGFILAGGSVSDLRDASEEFVYAATYLTDAITADGAELELLLNYAHRHLSTGCDLAA